MLIKRIKLNKQSKTVVRNTAFVLAVLFFLVSLVFAIRAFPASIGDLRPWPMVLVMVAGVPAMLLLNSAEYWLSAVFNNKRPSLRDSVEITIIARAANMLPLPGGTIARVAALKSLGVSVKDGIGINLLLAFLWLSLSLIYSSIWMWSIVRNPYAIYFLGLGIFILLPTAIYLYHRSKDPKFIFLVVTTKTLSLIVDSAKIYLCFQALAISATFAQASSLAVSGVLGSAVSIVPAGLGVREAVASLLASMVGLSLSSGFLAVALNRILSMSVILLFSFYLSRKTLRTGSVEKQE